MYMMILDDKHFFKVGGDFLMLISRLSEAVEIESINQILLCAGRLSQAFDDLDIEEIK